MKLLDDDGHVTPEGLYAGLVFRFGFVKGTIYWLGNLLAKLAFALVNLAILWWLFADDGIAKFRAFIAGL